MRLHSIKTTITVRRNLQTGRPKRNTIISEDEILNLRIELNTLTATEFILKNC